MNNVKYAREGEKKFTDKLSGHLSYTHIHTHTFFVAKHYDIS